MNALESEMMKLQFVYGNTHQTLKEFQTRGDLEFKHSWCAFVRPKSKKMPSKKFIRKVTFNFVPDYMTTSFVKNQPPFEHKCKAGWGYFEMEIRIDWHPWTKLKPTLQTFDLCFSRGGTKKTITVKINKDDVKSKIK
jgi:transcription initiation factor IIF auxiliary subunit